MVSEVRANLLLETTKHIKSDFHVINHFNNTALLYMNTNNGYTIK